MRNVLAAARQRFRRYPSQDDDHGVRQMVTDQWRGIAKRTPSYLEGYRYIAGSDDRAHRRSRWIANLILMWGAGSVLEVGCGAGRNLAIISHYLPHARLIGVDVNAEAIGVAEETVPQATLFCADLHTVEILPRADVVLACGVLGHIPPASLLHILRRLVAAAKGDVLIIDENGYGDIVKGPAAWEPERNTGDYVLWRHPLRTMLNGLVDRVNVSELPAGLQAPAARHVIEASR